MILPGISTHFSNDDETYAAVLSLIDMLAIHHRLSKDEYRYLLDHISVRELPYLTKKARDLTDQVYGRQVFFRGLIEISNICGRGCFYCGLQSTNTLVHRYRMSEEQILATVEEGYRLGFQKHQ